jgi:hypothetical protein
VDIVATRPLPPPNVKSPASASVIDDKAHLNLAMAVLAPVDVDRREEAEKTRLRAGTGLASAQSWGPVHEALGEGVRRFTNSGGQSTRKPPDSPLPVGRMCHAAFLLDGADLSGPSETLEIEQKRRKRKQSAPDTAKT